MDTGTQPPWGGLAKATDAHRRDIGTQPPRKGLTKATEARRADIGTQPLRRRLAGNPFSTRCARACPMDVGLWTLVSLPVGVFAHVHSDRNLCGRLDSLVRVRWPEPSSPIGLGRGRSSFVRHPIRDCCNQRGWANVTCLDGSSDALGGLTNGHVQWNLGLSFVTGLA